MGTEERKWMERIEQAKDKGPDDYEMLRLLSSGADLSTIQEYYKDLYIAVWRKRIKSC